METSEPMADVTGLVLAGGQGRRMGGLDKGLQRHRGHALAHWALQRLAPQVGHLAISANRHHEAYAAFGRPVWSDGPIGSAGEVYAGPLAGMMEGLRRCETRWLVTVPCDSPRFPTDLVARLHAAALAEDAELAMAATVVDGRVQRQPVFCLLRRDLHDSLADFLAGGERKVGQWTARHRCAQTVFVDADAFVNANTLDDLARLDHD